VNHARVQARQFGAALRRRKAAGATAGFAFHVRPRHTSRAGEPESDCEALARLEDRFVPSGDCVVAVQLVNELFMGAALPAGWRDSGDSDSLGGRNRWRSGSRSPMGSAARRWRLARCRR
jgi:hypothetical protein